MPARRTVLADAVAIVASAAGGIALALVITPMQSVATAGQRIEVGVTGPSLALTGPGELDLFGQRIPTTIDFVGPFRPRLRLTNVTLSEQLGQLTSSPSAGAHSLQRALVRGWTHYFAWEVVLAGVLTLAIAGAVTGWLRRPLKHAAVVIAVALVAAEAVNVGAIMVTAYTVPGKLRSVRSLQALVGGRPPPDVVRRSPSRPTGALRIAVVGDSTAAGLGNAPLPNGTADDRACHRSIDAYAVALSHAAGRTVDNLACSGATIRAGLLGPQPTGDRRQPPQVGARAVAEADLVIVSIGANDVHWADILRVCAVSRSCSNKAEQAYFQQQLAGFSRDYLQLLSQLQLLPRHPAVIVNRYFDPLSGDASCLDPVGMTAAKATVLHSDLAALNEILDTGAHAAGFAVADPQFKGHGICSAHPYVQGVHDPAPFHPTPSGELAIALADERALRGPS